MKPKRIFKKILKIVKIVSITIGIMLLIFIVFCLTSMKFLGFVVEMNRKFSDYWNRLPQKGTYLCEESGYTLHFEGKNLYFTYDDGKTDPAKVDTLRYWIYSTYFTRWIGSYHWKETKDTIRISPKSDTKYWSKNTKYVFTKIKDE